MLTNTTIGAAAKAAGIGERTAYRYLADPDVKAELAKALDDTMGHATGLAVRSMAAALVTLHQIHRDKEAPTGSRVSAARAILETAPKLREALDLAQRLDALERQMTEGGTGGQR